VLDGALRALGDVLLRAPLLFRRSGTGRAADRGHPFVVSTSCTGLVASSRSRVLVALRQLANRVQVVVGPGYARQRTLPTDTLVARPSPFGWSRARAASPSRRVNDEWVPQPRVPLSNECVSLSWSLARPRARIRPPPLCGFAAAHRLPTLSFAVGSRFRDRLRPTPDSVRPEGAARSTRRSGLSTSRLVGGRSAARRLLQSSCPIRGTTVESPDPRRPDIAYRCRFARAGSSRARGLACARSQLARRPKPSRKHQTR
jgi:hypothetical protein